MKGIETGTRVAVLDDDPIQLELVAHTMHFVDCVSPPFKGAANLLPHTPWRHTTTRRQATRPIEPDAESLA